MTRDYIEYMNMTANDLAQFAREAAEPHQVLLLALADMLDTVVEECNRLEDRNAELADAERRADSWREEAMAIQRQLDMVRG